MLKLALALPLGTGALFGLVLACSSAGDDKSPSQGSGGSAGASAGSPAVGGSASGASSSAGSPAGGTPSASGSGGTPVSGGQATGGASAGAGGGGAGGASTGSPCGTGTIFCSDFEAETIPQALVFYPEYLRANQQLITVDSTVFHGGSRSLKVNGSGSSQMLAVQVPSKFWGRVYLRSDADMESGHNTYVNAGTGDGDPNNGTYIRIGEHQCQLELNRNTDDKEILSNGGMYMCQGGVKMLKDTWYCLEFLYDGPGGETRVFVDGTEVTALHTTDWGTYDYKLFKFGFEKYGGNTKTIWYDDLAIAAEQLHCLSK